MHQQSADETGILDKKHGDQLWGSSCVTESGCRAADQTTFSTHPVRETNVNPNGDALKALP